MNNILTSFIIGIVAGIIDIIPMILSKQSKPATISAFLHWVALGLIIPFTDWGLPPWLTGIIIAELTAIPIMVLIYPKDPKAIIPMTIFSAVLGSGVGYAGFILIG